MSLGGPTSRMAGVFRGTSRDGALRFRSMDGWRDPRRWARTGRWLLLPVAVLDWFALVPQTVFVVAFVVALVGLVGIAARVVVAMLRRGRGAMAVLGVLLVLGGLALFGLDPFPGSFPLIESWWPSVITQPQHVGSAYWQLAALGVELTGVGLLATLLVAALTGRPGPGGGRAPDRPSAPDRGVRRG